MASLGCRRRRRRPPQLPEATHHSLRRQPARLAKGGPKGRWLPQLDRVGGAAVIVAPHPPQDPCRPVVVEKRRGAHLREGPQVLRREVAEQRRRRAGINGDVLPVRGGHLRAAGLGDECWREIGNRAEVVAALCARRRRCRRGAVARRTRALVVASARRPLLLCGGGVFELSLPETFLQHPVALEIRVAHLVHPASVREHREPALGGEALAELAREPLSDARPRKVWRRVRSGRPARRRLLRVLARRLG